MKLSGCEDVCVKVSGVKAADVKTSGHHFFQLLTGLTGLAAEKVLPNEFSVL